MKSSYRKIGDFIQQVNIKNEDGTVSEIYLELRANEKVCIPKKELLELNIDKPCKMMSLKNRIIDNYVDWLAARYKRPALPSEFDRRVDKAWAKKKREKARESFFEIKRVH